MKAIIFTTLNLLFLSSCSYQLATNEAPLENHIKRGERFKISLPENHAKGYMWQINSNYNRNVLDYYGSVFRGKEKGVDFNFRALKTAKSKLNFALIKYLDTIEVKEFIIDIQ